MKVEVYYAEFGELVEYMCEVPVLDPVAGDYIDPMVNEASALPRLDKLLCGPGEVDYIALCEKVYMLCNSISYAWYENDALKYSKYVKEKGGARSMSAGDYIKIVEKGVVRWFRCDYAGWEEIELKGEEAAMVPASMMVSEYFKDNGFNFDGIMIPFKLIEMLADINRAK